VQVVGDVDDGQLTLEESEDGKRISATWLGEVTEGRCGKEIRGTWSPEATPGASGPAPGPCHSCCASKAAGDAADNALSQVTTRYGYAPLLA